MEHDVVDRIRARLVEIEGELRGLASDDFAGKHLLNVEADELRALLSESTDSELLDRWAECAARKSLHTTDDEVAAAKAAVVPRSEGGGVG